MPLPIENNPGVGPQPYATPPAQSTKLRYSDMTPRTEPLPSLLILVFGLGWVVLCHAASLFALQRYIDQYAGPTARAIDTLVFCWIPGVASVMGCVATIGLVTFGRAMWSSAWRRRHIDQTADESDLKGEVTK